jgi:hypothetical protein
MLGRGAAVDPSDRIIVAMPLTELWNDAGPVPARRGRWLEREDIRGLLRAGPVRFVVANVGHKLRWAPPSECYAFWKAEVRGHLCAGDAIRLEDYPGHYCYAASEWHLDSGAVAIVLEMHH